MSCAPAERRSGSWRASNVGGSRRSSIGPCGLSIQRFFASEISSARTERKIAAEKQKKTALAKSIRLKRMRTIVMREAEERLFHAAPHGEDLEQLAHLGGREQLVRLRGERRVVQRIFDVGLAEHVGDAAIDEELRLRSVAEHVEPGRARRFGERRKVDVRREVLGARPLEHVAMRLVAVVAHQRARRALRMVVLVPRKAIVDHEDRALLKPLREAAQPRRAGQADLAFIGYGGDYFACLLEQDAGT